MVERKSGLAGIVDSILRVNPLVAAFVSFMGFAAIIVSVLIGIGFFEYELTVNSTSIEKEVGFVWAINWSICLLVLLPLLLFFGLMSYRGFRASLGSMVSKNMVLNQDGSIVTSDDLFEAWRSILVTISTLVALIIGMSLLYAYWEYWEVVGQHFENKNYPQNIDLHDERQERDWSVAALLPVAGSEMNTVDEDANRVFSLGRGLISA